MNRDDSEKRADRQQDMAKREKKVKEKKKRGFFRVLFGTIGAVVMLLILTAGGLGFYVYRSMKLDPVTVSSLDDYAKAPADESFRHLSFSMDGRMTQSYDDIDVRYFIAKFCKDQKLDPVEYIEDMGIAGLSLEGITAGIVPGQLEVTGVGSYGSIRLVARMLMDLELREGTVVAVPDRIKVAGIPVPVSLIDRYFKTDLGSFTLEYEPDEVFLSSIESLDAGEGRISLTGPMNTYLIDDAPLLKSRLMLMRLGQEEVRYTGAAIDSAGTDPAVRYHDLLEVLVQDPDEFIEFLRQIFSVTTAVKTVGLGIPVKNYGMAARWFKDFDADDYTEPRNAVYDKYYVLFRFMKTISGSISSAFSKGRLQVRSDDVYYNGEPFSADSFFRENNRVYIPLIDMDSGRLCTVRKQQGADRYAGMLIRGADGHGYLISFFSEDSFDILVVKEDVFTACMDSSSVPEFDLSHTENFIEGLPG